MEKCERKESDEASRVRGVLGYVCLLTAMWGALSSIVTAQSSPVLSAAYAPQFVGMHMLSPTRHWPTVPVGAVRPAGTTWGTLEPTRGAFDWHSLDTWVQQAAAHHVPLDYVLLNTPEWASSRPTEHCSRGPIGCAAPPHDKDWEDFLTALVTRYKGQIASYELWNEPNAIGFFSGSAADMAHMASLAYPIIKRIDPAATVVGPSPSSSGWPTPYDVWMDQFLQAGGGQNVDVLAWHAYAGRIHDPANPPEDVAAQVRRLRAVIDRHGLGQLPLWDTEGGWGKDTQLPDLDAQAAFLARWYLIQFSLGVGRAYWYQWDNPDYGTLWTEGSGSTPAAAALAQVEQWLTGVTSASPCVSSSGSLWTCALYKKGVRYLAVWSTNGTQDIPASIQSKGFADLNGIEHPAASQTIKAGASPILVKLT